MKQILCVALYLIQAAAFSQDLVVTDYAGPTTFSRYEDFSVDITVKNIGIVGINKYFNVEVYLSTDDQWQDTDILLPRISLSSLGAGQSYTGKAYLQGIDATPGTYYLILNADRSNYITETDETNNLLIVPDVVITQPDVDFTFTSISLDTTDYTQNSMVKPNFRLENLGSTNTGGPMYIKFVLSTDATYSQSDKTLKSLYVSLSGSDIINSDQYLGLVLPTVTNGTYYILTLVDNNNSDIERFEETDESNNMFAIPITIQSSDIDLEINYVYNSSYDYGILRSDISVYNQGTTGVAGYLIGVELINENGSPTGIYNIGDINPEDSYIDPKQSTFLILSFHLYEIPPGTYYPRYVVNNYNPIAESDVTNNTFIDYSNPIVIAPPPVPGIKLNSLSTSGVVDDTDQQIGVKLNLTNTGNTTGFNQNYTFLVKDPENNTVHSQQANVAVDFDPGNTVTTSVTLNLPSVLPVGSYTISITCTSSCYTTPSLVSTTLTVSPTQYTVAGSVQGEDGIPITNGKLFLYQKDESGNVRFIQKILPYQDTAFEFGIDGNPHTLYFIPDPIDYPGYVPTIYGKTIALQESNFFTASENIELIVEVLKVNKPEPGPGIVKGSVYATSTQGEIDPLSSTPTADIPVILISSTGQIVGIAYTDEAGFFEFQNLPRDSYQLMLGFKLDDPLIMSPFDVDITEKNIQVDLELSADGVVPVTSLLFLPQILTFNEFPIYKYGSPRSIVLDAKSDTGLPVTYSSSDDNIAIIEDNEIIIKGVGMVIINAQQAGNTFYLPASIDRSLVINKGSQILTMNPLEEKKFGDHPFSIQVTSSVGLETNLVSSDPAIASVSGNIVTIHNTGTVEITAEQPGNALFEAALLVRETLTIEKAEQSISFDALPDRTSDAGSFILSATTTSGLDISFESSDEKIVSIIGNVAAIHQGGIVSITAHQAGNQNYLAAEAVVHDLVINFVLGIEAVDMTASIFPNPTTDLVFVQIPDITTIEVFDVQGRIRKEITWTENKIDFSQVEEGVYLIKLTNKNTSLVTRIIKK